jgi:glutamate-ammonia-ligase adenylyltransferase
LLRQRIEGLIEEAILSSNWQPEMGREVRTIRHRMEQTAHADNLKRGVGGTVDVELVAQSLTLQHAKDFPQIIQHGTTATLAALAETGCLDEKKSLELINGYRTLRRIEANLRLMNTPARHELPASDAGEMKNLAYLMNESDPAMLVAQCRQARQNNRAIFDQVFDKD